MGFWTCLARWLAHKTSERVFWVCGGEVKGVLLVGGIVT